MITVRNMKTTKGKNLTGKSKFSKVSFSYTYMSFTAFKLLKCRVNGQPSTPLYCINGLTVLLKCLE